MVVIAPIKMIAGLERRGGGASDTKNDMEEVKKATWKSFQVVQAEIQLLSGVEEMVDYLSRWSNY